MFCMGTFPDAHVKARPLSLPYLLVIHQFVKYQ